jgi:hypothetical protein
MALLPTAQENTGIAAMFVPATTYYLGLNTATPGTTGASEVTGGSYVRQSITFGSASGGSEASTNAQTFTGFPVEAGGCPYFSLWTASTSGTYLGGGSTTGLSGAISAGSTVSFAIGAVTVALS